MSDITAGHHEKKEEVWNLLDLKGFTLTMIQSSE
jgi:hypothetical protein